MSADRFAERSAALAGAVRAHDAFAGLVLLGSASEEAAARRDEWSDHDFFAVTAPGEGPRLRPDLSWLPDREQLALTAREGEIGFVALYDDGHVFEFAYADAAELDGALATDASVVADDEAGTVAGLVAASRERASAADRFDAANDARLVLVKLLLGVGRARRGETLNAGTFVRTWAVQHLVRAIRGRAASAGEHRDLIDPLRRFEHDFPEDAARIADAVARPVEAAAVELFAFTRARLEPGWAAFPTRAADVVARRLGW